MESDLSVQHQPDPAGRPAIQIRDEPKPRSQSADNAPIAEFTMARLMENYNSILNAKAIFYPVAYQLLRELGHGRQGVVFLALRQGSRGCITEHAIKLYSPDLYRSPEEYWTDMGRIASQISKLHRLQGPNIVSRYSYEETHGIGYVQLEAIDGIDLERLLQKDHLATVKAKSTPKEWAHFTRTIFRIEGERLMLQPGIAIHVLRSVLRGLERLHSAGFLHCDIKPANIMIDRLGNVKIIDFGRAVVVGERLSFLLGSPRYMAPEIHRRERYSPQADVYSVGLVALEMLRGEPLAVCDKTEEELLKTKTDLPFRLYQLLPQHVLANRHLVSILRKFVDPVPGKRYSSVRDAEAGEEGLRLIDKQLVQAGLDSEYSRDLSDYLSKLVDPRTQRIELSHGDRPE